MDEKGYIDLPNAFMKHALLDLSTANTLLATYAPSSDTYEGIKPLDLRWNALYHIQQGYEKGAKAVFYKIFPYFKFLFDELNADSKSKIREKYPYVFSGLIFTDDGKEGLSIMPPKKLNHDFEAFTNIAKNLSTHVNEITKFLTELVTLFFTDKGVLNEEGTNEALALFPKVLNAATFPIQTIKSSKKKVSLNEVSNAVIASISKDMGKYAHGDGFIDGLTPLLPLFKECVALFDGAIRVSAYESLTRYGLTENKHIRDEFLNVDVISKELEELTHHLKSTIRVIAFPFPTFSIK